MARLQQINPNNYRSSPAISAEFENIIRYLGAAERGNQTLSEMLQNLFDASGNLDLGVDFKFDGDGLQMKVGADGEWIVLATPAALRGNDGRDIGDVALPIIAGRLDAVASSGQTVFSYAHGATDTLFVFKNGALLQPTADYSHNSNASTITLASAAAEDDVITAYRVRGTGGVTVTRNFIEVTAPSQAVFGVSLPDEDYQTQIFLNGIMLAPDLDYVINEGLQTITLLEAAVQDDILAVIFFQADDATTVPGFMLEGVFTNAATGLIPWEKIEVANGSIPSIKVEGLADLIDETPRLSIGSGTPANPSSGDLWLDTSSNPAQLKFYDGTQFLSTAPSSTLPAIRTSDANYLVAINSTGTGFVYRQENFSALIWKTEKGAAGGVATLDNDGYLDPTQIPPVRATETIFVKQLGAVADGTIVLHRFFMDKVRILGVSIHSTSGTATAQLDIGGTNYGPTMSVAAAANDQSFGTVIEIDALVASKKLSLDITSASSLNDLFVTIVVERLN